MSKSITIFRKRHIPKEIIKLKDDIILKFDGNVLVTKWKCIHPRKDIESGISAYYINDGYKVSKMFDAAGELVYWYCDIMTMHKGDNEGEFIYEDMLLDVIVYPDGYVEVVDAGEFAEAFERDMISKESAIKALNSMDKLLKIIYSGEFDTLKAEIENI